MIPAGRTELRKVCDKHFHVSENEHLPSYYLLLFYAVECGLKAVYLQRRKFSRTDQITDETLRKSHDLMTWSKELRLPASITGKNTSFRLQRDNTYRWRISRAHEAWRYGVVIEPADEEELISWLKRVYDWVKENT